MSGPSAKTSPEWVDGIGGVKPDAAVLTAEGRRDCRTARGSVLNPGSSVGRTTGKQVTTCIW